MTFLLALGGLAVATFLWLALLLPKEDVSVLDDIDGDLDEWAAAWPTWRHR